MQGKVSELETSKYHLETERQNVANLNYQIDSIQSEVRARDEKV